MDLIQLKNLIIAKKSTVWTLIALSVLLIGAVTALQTFKYRATSKILVVQNTGPVLDSYSISRSNQYLSNILSQVIYSGSFFEYALNSGYNINADDFSDDPITRKKQWQKMVSAKSISDTGMIVVITYHQDKIMAERLNRAIAYTLKLRHSQYHGLGTKVDIRVIDGPIVSRFPIKPNIFLNLALSLVIGFTASIFLIYLFPDFEFRRSNRPKFTTPVEATRHLPNRQSEFFSQATRRNYSEFIEPYSERWRPYQTAPNRESARQSVDDPIQEDDLDNFSNQDEGDYFQGDINNLLRR